MRKTALGIMALLYLTVQSVTAEVLITAQDYAVDSDVVLESAVKEIKSAPRDTVNVIGDTLKYASDETVTAVKGAAALFKSDPVEKAEKAALVEVANAWDSSNDILFRSYKVTDAVGEELAAGATASKSGALDVSGSFSGIQFKRKTSAYFRPEFNRLFIRQTLENILAIEDVLAELHSAERYLMGKQVSIETKFVEVNQSTLNELGFDWTFDSKYGGNANIFENLSLPAGTDLFSGALRSGVGVLAGGKVAALGPAASGALADSVKIAKTAGSLRWNLVINALEQSDDADVLSAPSIVTRHRSEANIVVGEQRTVSRGFDVGSSESSLFIEHDLESDIMGVQLTVTPEIRSDNLIDLELNPKVIDLIGYDTYQSHPSAIMYPIQGNNSENFDSGTWGVPLITKLGVAVGGPDDGFEVRAVSGRVPYYRLREIETQATVADGSTVAMGGLMYEKLETFKDKVPVLGSIPLVGRLFRSEGEKNVKRNLMIFVTATQVDVNGRKASDLALQK